MSAATRRAPGPIGTRVIYVRCRCGLPSEVLIPDDGIDEVAVEREVAAAREAGADCTGCGAAGFRARMGLGVPEFAAVTVRQEPLPLVPTSVRWAALPHVPTPPAPAVLRALPELPPGWAKLLATDFPEHDDLVQAGLRDLHLFDYSHFIAALRRVLVHLDARPSIAWRLRWTSVVRLLTGRSLDEVLVSARAEALPASP